MSRRLFVPALIAVIGIVAVAAFIWRYGDSTAPVSRDHVSTLVGGWHEADLTLPELSDELPGIADAAAGLPRQGTYLVNLWASYCTPCKTEMPLLEQLHASGEVQVIGVTRDHLLPKATEAITQAGVTYPNVRDQYGDFMESISAAVPPAFLPSSFLVVDGTIRWTHLGDFRSYEDLRDSVLDHLGSTPTA